MPCCSSRAASSIAVGCMAVLHHGASEGPEGCQMTLCHCSSDAATWQAKQHQVQQYQRCMLARRPWSCTSAVDALPFSCQGVPLCCRAVLRVWLRRQGSSRKLQRMWRGFVKRRQTTHALAVSVAETGITGVKLPQVRLLDWQRATVQRWCTTHMVVDGTNSQEHQSSILWSSFHPQCYLVHAVREMLNSP